MEFENKVYEGIYYSQFIASWVRVGGNFNKYTERTDDGHSIIRRKTKFQDWLESIIINGHHIPKEVIKEIYMFATNGKYELEVNAKHFLCEN